MRNIEPIAETDAEDLVKFFDNAGPFVSARTRSDYWLYARLFGSTCLCTRDDEGRPTSVVISFIDQTPGKHEIYVQDVAVAADHRGHGHGRALMERLHEIATERNINRVWLTSEPNNSAALRLWMQLGYSNPTADYEVDGVWITADLKGPGKDRAVFEWRPSGDQPVTVDS